MKIKDIKETRGQKIAEMRTLSDKAKGENRDLSGEERTRFDALDTEVRTLNNRLSDAERLAEYERLESAETVSGAGMGDELRSYSLSKAIQEGSTGRLTGLEAEAHQELSKDRSEVRGVMVPTEMVLGGENRALTTTTPGGGPGSNLIATDLAAMTDLRRSVLKIEALGSTVLRGLNGNLDLPRFEASGTAGWVSEHGPASRSDAQFQKKTMSPHTVTAEYEVSRRMMLQSNEVIDTILRQDLAYLMSQALDSAAIRGGGAEEPTGVLADANVAEVDVSATTLLGKATSKMIESLDRDDVTGTRAFLTNPQVMNVARTVTNGEGDFKGVEGMFHKERVESSTQVPSDLGTGNDLNAVIYGEWASLYLGYWSGIDLLMNPYHSDVASKGGALIHAFLDADVIVRHPEAFRWAALGDFSE